MSRPGQGLFCRAVYTDTCRETRPRELIRSLPTLEADSSWLPPVRDKASDCSFQIGAYGFLLLCESDYTRNSFLSRTVLSGFPQDPDTPMGLSCCPQARTALHER